MRRLISYLKKLIVSVMNESDANPMFYRSMARVANNLAAACLKLGKITEAIAACNLAIYNGYKGAAVEELLNILITKSEILKAIGQPEDAEMQERYVRLSYKIMKENDLFKDNEERISLSFSLISVL